jgi:transketolase
LILSRQNVPALTDGSAVAVGAATVVATSSPAAVIVATGSEVGPAVEAAAALKQDGTDVNVVSMPSWDIFERQSAAHKASVFPAGVPVVSVEAGTTFGWSRYADASVGIDRFGASAPGNVVMDKLGINVASIVETVKSVLK